MIHTSCSGYSFHPCTEVQGPLCGWSKNGSPGSWVCWCSALVTWLNFNCHCPTTAFPTTALNQRGSPFQAVMGVPYSQGLTTSVEDFRSSMKSWLAVVSFLNHTRIHDTIFFCKVMNLSLFPGCFFLDTLYLFIKRTTSSVYCLAWQLQLCSQWCKWPERWRWCSWRLIENISRDIWYF